MARETPLRDPRVEPIDPPARPSDAYLHRAARIAVLLAIPAFVASGDLPRLRGPASSTARVERAAPGAPRGQSLEKLRLLRG